MFTANDREYYVTRAATSRRLADKAFNPQIAEIHREMAERYDTLIRRVENNEPKLIAV